ncbi:hypothetical protein BDN72DRAFT_833559, partial [Pluteus cervinus]
MSTFDNSDARSRAYLDSVPYGLVEAFRNSIYKPNYIKANPQKFLGTDWVDIEDL